MTNAAKRRALILFLLVTIFTTLLAVTLPQLELQKGTPLPQMSSEEETPGAGSSMLQVNSITFLKTALIIAVVFTFFFILARQREQPVNLREMSSMFMKFFILIMVTLAIFYAFSNVRIELTPTAAEILPPPVDLPVMAPPTGMTPDMFSWMGWVVLVVLCVLMAFWLVSMRIGRPRATLAQDALAQEAEQAMQAIKSGEDLNNVIIRCYKQMGEILRKEQKLTLGEAMTAREFEALLEKRGVPNAPVRQLTRLFEMARYGANAPGAVEEGQAVECLNAIALFSKTRKDGPRA